MTDIEKIKKLRLSTGAGFKDCSAALKESNGDLDKAAEILRVKGIAKASKKMSRDAKEGVIVVSGDSNKTSLIEVNCETDFVAKNNDFINFVKELSELNNKYNSDQNILINTFGVFKSTFSLPLDAAIDLGVDTLRMQGIVNLTERFEIAGETEIFLGSEDSETVDDNQSASTTNNDRQSLRGTFVLSDSWRAEADLRSGYRSDESGSMLELLLNLHWRLWAR